MRSQKSRKQRCKTQSQGRVQSCSSFFLGLLASSSSGGRCPRWPPPVWSLKGPRKFVMFVKADGISRVRLCPIPCKGWRTICCQMALFPHASQCTRQQKIDAMIVPAISTYSRSQALRKRGVTSIRHLPKTVELLAAPAWHLRFWRPFWAPHLLFLSLFNSISSASRFLRRRSAQSGCWTSTCGPSIPYACVPNLPEQDSSKPNHGIVTCCHCMPDCQKVTRPRTRRQTFGGGRPGYRSRGPLRFCISGSRW